MAADAARRSAPRFRGPRRWLYRWRSAFLATVNAELAKRPPGHRKIFLFVHGFNTMFAEALYGFTQVVHDAHTDHVPVLFTWASRGKLTDYLYDNNSATAARDQLAHTIRLLTDSNAEEVNILAHSMGNWVFVEAMRQIKMQGGLKHPEKIGLVLLAAPDIDIDVFKSDLRAYGKLKKPYYIVLSKDDKALALSKFLAGGQTRVGDDGNVQDLAKLGAVVIDLTNVHGDDPSDHNNTHRSPRSPRNWSTCFKAASKRTMSRRLTQRIR